MLWVICIEYCLNACTDKYFEYRGLVGWVGTCYEYILVGIFLFSFFVIVEDTTSHMFCIKYNNSTIYNNTTVHGIIMYDKRDTFLLDWIYVDILQSRVGVKYIQMYSITTTIT